MPEATRDQMRSAAATNMTRQCTTEGCTGRRNSAFGKLCGGCRSALRNHGTTDRLRTRTHARKAYAAQIKFVTQLISLNPHSEAIHEAKKKIALLLYRSQTAPTGFGDNDEFKVYVPARLPVRVLADANVMPISLLICTSAAWIHARMNPLKFDGRGSIARHLGRAFLRTHSWNSTADGRIKEADARELGEFLWVNLAKFFVHMETLGRSQGKADAALEEALAEGLPNHLKLSPSELAFVMYRKDEIIKCLNEETKQKLNLNRNDSSNESGE